MASGKVGWQPIGARVRRLQDPPRAHSVRMQSVCVCVYVRSVEQDMRSPWPTSLPRDGADGGGRKTVKYRNAK